MLNYILTILASFFLTLLISVPYIKLLYKFNIRRISKTDLDRVMPGKKIKMGTPIMGGAVIIASVVVLSVLFMPDWEYLYMILAVGIFGAILGGIDEYTNTLGRTILAIRKSRPNPSESLIKAHGIWANVKKVVLIPWKWFEEALRVMGSEQRGLKSHYKFLMYLLITFVVVYFLIVNNHQPAFYIPYLGVIDFGWFYYAIVIFLLIGFATAFGITDGLDGLSAGTHSVSFTMFGLIAAYLGYKEVATLSFIIVGAELAFLYFNIKPARMEMSDVGTLPIGMFFVIVSILIYREVSLLLIGSLFIIEILSSVGQQWSVKLRKKRIFLVAPIHHHFEKLGWSENKVVERFWLFTIISGLIGVVVALI